PIQMNKMLKVLEDRKVFLESAYYSEENTMIPTYIHDIFQKGLPADFRLVGATTRSPEEIPPAIRSRCLEVFFRELDTEEIQKVAKNAAEKVEMQIGENGIEMIGMYARNGREAINLVQISAGMAINEERSFIKDEDIEWVVHSSQLTPKYEKHIYPIPRIGLVNGLAVYGPNTGAGHVIQCLKKLGVTTVFGYPGGAILPVYDALYESGLKHVLTRHEQAAIHAAEGYARASGKVGVVFATSGPGATNLVTGLADAYMDSIPLVVITGQVATPLIGKDGFQEADVVGITVPVTKHNYQVRDVNHVSRIVQEAFYIAKSGRPGPVLIDIPKDVQNAKVTSFFNEEVDIPGYKPELVPDSMKLREVAKAI
ncbi:thiamine pyrophosphate-binding protein, partial [Bacillus sp. SS-TM]